MPQLEQRLTQKQILTPQQILQASLLQLNTLNLEQKILDELESNPVLEPVETAAETTETEPEPEQTPEEDLDVPDDFEEYEPPNVYDHSREEVDLPLPEQKDFVEGLIEQLNLLNLNEEERAIAEEILWNLDDRGYLATDLVLIADRFGMEEEDILPILKQVQHLEPPGIAARNLQECLQIQLEDQPDSLAYKIITHCFDDFANKRFEAIERKLGCTEAELAEAIETISHLNPRPGEGRMFTRSEVVVPDLIVREQDGEWHIQTNDGGLPELQISPDYLAMMEAKSSLPTDAQRYLKRKLDSGHWFIQAIRQRRQTMKAVMKAIIERQPEFFAGNIHKLRPMKLQDIADDIGMDISTVSRSTRGKYVDTVYGVFELKSFFTEGVSREDGSVVSTHQVKRALKEIIDGEDKHHPYNDEQLVAKLKERGYSVARRTVAKYREQMNIPVARLRRQL
jgi:RNA polymerase sigma-54 factor